MKSLLLAVIVSIASLNAFAAAETKKVCHDEIKNGKTSQVCKTIKVHKKLEGTDIPEKKK
jgi:hypothetical protein